MRLALRRRARVVAASAVAAAAAYVLVGRPWQLTFGSTGEEAAAALPGDDLIGHADVSASRAITIAAGADEVWPWVAQIGQGRGGFYSYDRLENLIGCQIHSADRVVPEWQAIAVGDEIRLAPKVALRVAHVDEGRALVLRGAVPIGSGAPPYDFTWAFVLREAPDGSTRLVLRERYAYLRPWARLIVEPTEAISLVMSRKLLAGVRDRVERASRSTTKAIS